MSRKSLPLLSKSPEDYARFLNGYRRYLNGRRREREIALNTLAELLGTDEGYYATNEEIGAAMGLHRDTIIRYKNILVERGRCKHCGQVLPVVAHLEKSQQAIPPPPK